MSAVTDEGRGLRLAGPAQAASVPTALLVLTDDDQALIAAARNAFARDFRYLEQVLWAARTRLNP